MRRRTHLFTGGAAALAVVLCLGTVYSASQTGRRMETETEWIETETEWPGTELPIFVLEDKSTGMEACLMAPANYAAAEMEDCMSSEPAMVWWNTSEYATVDETGFRDVTLYPFSTFGMDVDTASYAQLRSNALDGTLEWLPKDAVRIEEMINYFTYDYEAPEGDDVFGITVQIADCPWNPDTKLMLVGLQARDIPQEEIPDQNLVFLVDTSGSMYDQDKLPLAVETLEYLLNSMDENDTISIVTYAGSSEVALEGTRCTEEGKEEIIAVLEGLQANGGTYGEGGIRTAYDMAQQNYIPGGNNRVLLLTDGDFNLGQTDDSELTDLVKEKADGKIFLSIMGFGSGNYNDALAEQLADNGNGNYSYIDSDREARRVMGAALNGTLNTVAQDAKIQLDFNPAQISGYRLVGYENRQMDAEDFEDDTKDGGEVGAGQQVTVLYELVMSGSDFEIPKVESRYTANAQDGAAQTEAAQTEARTEDAGQADETAAADETKTVTLAVAQDPETEEAPAEAQTEEQTEAAQGASSQAEEYLTVSIRYKDPGTETSKLVEYAVDASDEISEMSDNMSWAAGVAQVGMLLRESEFAGTSSFDEIRDRLRGLTGGDEFREEFLYLMRRLDGAHLGEQ